MRETYTQTDKLTYKIDRELMNKGKDDETITMVQENREIRGKSDRHSAHKQARDGSKDNVGGVKEVCPD